MSCTVDGKRVVVGNDSFMSSNDAVPPPVSTKVMATLQDDGKTAILIAIDGVVVAVVGIADEVKKESAATIQFLQTMGIDAWMVTGDNCQTALAVSRDLGLSIDHEIAEALPVTKLKKVQHLQASGHVVAMVGDGINDSPALAQSNVGIAIGTSDIAAEAADSVLVRGAIFDAVVAFDLSRRIFHRI